MMPNPLGPRTSIYSDEIIGTHTIPPDAIRTAVETYGGDVVAETSSVDPLLIIFMVIIAIISLYLFAGE